ncbi:hypothetical protein H0E87_003926 [Populus deltoides]|uniref:Uncharacterized protein n=1 Tax=Populus deltoides TaxID=3696 RepID=A0A8T2ZCC8_POPDE|nr:hypothetical protein H0E87_003926 [Populus deltoides]
MLADMNGWSYKHSTNTNGTPPFTPKVESLLRAGSDEWALLVPTSATHLSFFVALKLQDAVMAPDPCTQMPSTTWQLILEHMEQPQAAGNTHDCSAWPNKIRRSSLPCRLQATRMLISNAILL